MTQSVSFQTEDESYFAVTGNDVMMFISNPYKVFDVREYGAKADDATDDTTSIQNCINAAAAYVAGGVGLAAEVYLPKGVYVVQDPTTGSTSTACLTIPGTARNIRVHGPSAVLKIGPNGADACALRIFGAHCEISWLQIDCNADVALVTKGNTAFEINGSNDIGVQGTDNVIFRCKAFNGLKSGTPTQGEEHFMEINGTRNHVLFCDSYQSGWQAFRANCWGSKYIGCRAYGHKGNGFRVLKGGEMWITDFISRTTPTDGNNQGRHSIIIDPGSNGPDRIDRVWIDRAWCYGDSDGTPDGGVSVLKVASVRECFVSNSYFYAGNSYAAGMNNACRFEDSVGLVKITNTTFLPCVLFTPYGTGIFQGAITGNASGTGAKAQLTLTAHGMTQIGKSLYVRRSDIPAYNREHIIEAIVDANTVRTDQPYVAGSIGANAWAHTGIDVCIMEDVTIDHTGVWDDTGVDRVWHIDTAVARIFKMKRVKFIARTARTEALGCMAWYADDRTLDLLEVEDCEAVFNTSSSGTFIRPSNQGTREVQQLTFSTAITSGTFTLTHNGNTTGAITFSTNTTTLASNIQTALRLLPGLSAVLAVYISGTFGSTNVIIEVRYVSVAGNTPQLTTDPAGLTGGTPTITPATTVAGVLPNMLMDASKVVIKNLKLTNLNSSGTTEIINRNGQGNTGLTYVNRAYMYQRDGLDPLLHYGTAAPSVNDGVSFPLGARVRNSAPSAGSRPGWVCVTAGTPGTWQQEAALS